MPHVIGPICSPGRSDASASPAPRARSALISSAMASQSWPVNPRLPPYIAVPGPEHWISPVPMSAEVEHLLTNLERSVTVLQPPPSTHAGRRSKKSLHSRNSVGGQSDVVVVGVVVVSVLGVVGVGVTPQLSKLPPSHSPTILLIPDATALQAFADFASRN